MTSGDSKVQKVQTNFQALSSVASSLNAASDELTKVIGVLDEALKKLNLGLIVWVGFRWRSSEPPYYDLDQIGYSKINGKWGIALRRIWGDESHDVESEEGPWLFNDAPREMRLHSVDKIPALIEELGKEALTTAKRVQEKAREARELANAIEKIASDQANAKGGK